MARQYRACALGIRLSGLQAPTLARSLHSGLPPPQTTYQHQPTYSLFDAHPAIQWSGREGRNVLRVWKGGEGRGNAGEEGVVAWECVFHEAVCGVLCCTRSNERAYDQSVLPN